MKTIWIILVIYSINAALTCAATQGFFLKGKHIPRLGRRAENRNFFMKSTKNIPMMGRRSEYPLDFQGDTIARTKKMLESRLNQEMNYNVIEPASDNPMYDLYSKNLLALGDLKFVSWTDFDSALAADDELYLKIEALGKDPASYNKYGYEDIVPLYQAPSKNDVLYYRVDRDMGLNEEDTKYQS